MLGTWIVFGIAIVLGIHGIMRLSRQRAYTSIARKTEVFINVISEGEKWSHEERGGVSQQGN